ncbi:hypothetical protein [Microbacterium sp. NPDC080220]|uniref:hypothetical protein n=1 Tax=Microbacterium sp. NPDC080220 TaxID=3161017 RepID=UPI00341ADB13
MNLQQTAELLTLIQIIDNRRVDEAVILAWQELVEDLDSPVAREAVKLHRRETSDWITPAHVRANYFRILNAQRFPEDDHGNALAPDHSALEAQDRLSRGQMREVTS